MLGTFKLVVESEGGGRGLKLISSAYNYFTEESLSFNRCELVVPYTLFFRLLTNFSVSSEHYRTSILLRAMIIRSSVVIVGLSGFIKSIISSILTLSSSLVSPDSHDLFHCGLLLLIC